MKSRNSNGIKAIVFDWGRTLHDPEADDLFPGARELLSELKGRFGLYLVSLAKSETPEERQRKIETMGIAGLFKELHIGGEDKHALYDRLFSRLGIPAEEMLIVDDQMSKGIAWGNRHGTKTVWLKKGKFSDQLPTAETGNPDFIVSEIKEIEAILKNLSL